MASLLALMMLASPAPVDRLPKISYGPGHFARAEFVIIWKTWDPDAAQLLSIRCDFFFDFPAIENGRASLCRWCSWKTYDYQKSIEILEASPHVLTAFPRYEP